MRGARIHALHIAHAMVLYDSHGHWPRAYINRNQLNSFCLNRTSFYNGRVV